MNEKDFNDRLFYVFLGCATLTKLIYVQQASSMLKFLSSYRQTLFNHYQYLISISNIQQVMGKRRRHFFLRFKFLLLISLF